LDGRDRFSYGHLTFGGHDLDKSTILDDVRIFYLEFRGEPEETNDREAWADNLRADVLNRLTSNGRSWYLSMIDGSFDSISDLLARILAKRLDGIEAKSEKPHGYTYGFIPRPFFEIPNQNLSDVVHFFWSEAVPGYPIEGYNLDVGQINVLRKWDARSRDDQLFREVIDRTYVNFYTTPAEHRHFVFVTNKLNYAELARLIRLDELQEKAKDIGRETK